MFGSACNTVQAFLFYIINYHFTCPTPIEFRFTASMLPSTDNMTNSKISCQVTLYCIQISIHFKKYIYIYFLAIGDLSDTDTYVTSVGV